jgi:hypothetical protein
MKAIGTCITSMILCSISHAVSADPIVTITPPMVIELGETAHITLTVRDWRYELNFYYQGFYWADAAPYETEITFYDGIGGSVYSPVAIAPYMPLVSTWSVPVTYPDQGTFFPYFDARIIDRLTRSRIDANDCPFNGHAFCVAFVNYGGDFLTSVTVSTPGPIMGAGLPGLLFLCGLIPVLRSKAKRPTGGRL